MSDFEERIKAAQVADARALWAVRVLDAWLAVILTRSAETYAEDNGARVILRDEEDDRHDFLDDTPDAARLAAAEAVFPELPADVRQQLGDHRAAQLPTPALSPSAGGADHGAARLREGALPAPEAVRTMQPAGDSTADRGGDCPTCGSRRKNVRRNVTVYPEGGLSVTRSCLHPWHDHAGVNQ